MLRLSPPIGAPFLRTTRTPAGKGQHAAAAVLEKLSVSSALPVTPCLHQACLAPPGPTALQKQQHPALMEAWGQLAYMTMAEPATMCMSLWDTVVTTGYPSMVERPRGQSLVHPPAPRHAVRALPAKGSCPALRPPLPGFNQHPPLQGITLPLPHREGVRRPNAHLPAGV